MDSPDPTTEPERTPPRGDLRPRSERPWWRDAVIYQVYIRSFADGDGDGLGDISGLRARLGHLADLGVDALWINPWYPSPMADAGYDVADHRGVEPRFGSLADAEALIADAHAHGLRVILDLVPNHTSDQHAWFRAARAAGPGSPERARYHFRDGRGRGGDEPPNNWRSEFGGPAWTRVVEADGELGQWYLHLFAPEQPDLNWDNPEVVADVEETLRFWFDRGVDGFRIDVAHSLVKAPGLPDLPSPTATEAGTAHPAWDQPGVHAVYQRWRALGDSYAEPRVFVAEAWVPDPEALARYVRPDELHTAFNFEFLVAPWIASSLRQVIDATLASHRRVGAPATWVVSNHDSARVTARLSRPPVLSPDRPIRFLDDLLDRPSDPATGLRRARAAALLMLALPGGAYIYQGDELGLPEVEDLPDDALQDPMWERSGRTHRGRDGCRVPIPWEREGPSLGFGPADGAAPWLPQPPDWSELSVDAQSGVATSTLELHRQALALRRAHPALGDGALRWLDSSPDALVFTRDPCFLAVVNLGRAPIGVPDVGAARLLVSSAPLTDDGEVPADTAAWFSVG